MQQIGSFLLILGGIVILIGLALLLFPKSWGWLGHLPGDLRFKLGERGQIFLPLGTSLVISLVLSLLATLILQLARLLRR